MATIILSLFNLRQTAKRAGRAAERLDGLERINAFYRQMLEAASRRPRSREELRERLRGGGSDTRPMTALLWRSAARPSRSASQRK